VEGEDNMKWVCDRNSVCIKEPNIQSRASLVLLKNYYREIYIKQWVKFRQNYIRRQKELHHGLFCHYCGKQLIEKGVHPEKLTQQENDLVATVDHIIPLCLGGAERDESNLCVSCRACNNTKDAFVNDVKRGLIDKEQYLISTHEQMSYRKEQAQKMRKKKQNFFRSKYSKTN
jgi:5-methylcytosine-specific restriction endonuclease McrA